RILDGSYPAGTQLKELVLAREFNVSQAPIREALRELEGSGLVHSERYRGTLVRGTDFHEILDSYELRATLETRALHLALPYGEALIAELQRCHGQMRAALQAEDPERYIDYAMRFHRRLMEGSGNRAFLNVWDSLLWDVRGRIVLQRFVETGRSFALQDDAAAHIPQQRIPDIEEGAIAAALHEAPVKAHGIVDIALGILGLQRSAHLPVTSLQFGDEGLPVG